MPRIEIDFKHTGATAALRGEKGQLILVVKEPEEGKAVIKLNSLADFTEELQETFSEQNQTYIKQALAEAPSEVVVIRYNEDGTSFEEDMDGNSYESLTSLSDVFQRINEVANRNCWITIADQTSEDAKELVTFVKSAVKFDKKRYKGLVYQANSPDDMHIVNFTTDGFRFKGEDEEIRDGVELIPMVAGALAGQPFDMSIIARPFGEIDWVKEPEDKDKAVDEGEFFFFNDEGSVRVGRGVNSLVTTGGDISDDMKFIMIVEQMDLIYSDIYETWNLGYKGRYKNSLDNQMLLVSAIKAYLDVLEQEQILDVNFDNNIEIDAHSQKLANLPIYGAEEVESWSENKILEMTVGTNVYLQMKIKMLNAMEDIAVKIFM